MQDHPSKYVTIILANTHMFKKAQKGVQRLKYTYLCAYLWSAFGISPIYVTKNNSKVGKTRIAGHEVHMRDK